MLTEGETYICHFTSLKDHLLITVTDDERSPHQFFIPKDPTSETLLKNEHRLNGNNSEVINKTEIFNLCKLTSKSNCWVIEIFEKKDTLVFRAPFYETCEYC